ncbi:hypothetical protein V2I01_38480 [Micromonospora sp. BRA006-A]|nr:hypothetical protein [Micromonospora sp. BRA006-A]
MRLILGTPGPAGIGPEQGPALGRPLLSAGSRRPAISLACWAWLPNGSPGWRRRQGSPWCCSPRSASRRSRSPPAGGCGTGFPAARPPSWSACWLWYATGSASSRSPPDSSSPGLPSSRPGCSTCPPSRVRRWRWRRRSWSDRRYARCRRRPPA